MPFRIFPCALFLFACLPAAAQFDPQVGFGAQLAVYKDSSAIKAWATGCTVTRGPKDISNPSGGNASLGEASYVLGTAGDGYVLSLGDGGTALLTFAKPIKNGTGADFAVFENGFLENNTKMAFLELAFVEVSSDGETFFRFPAVSNVDTSVQTASFGTTDASFLNNLAGKYIANYGTPFDLEELKTVPGLDVSHITHVKIIDVVGSLNAAYATRDSKGNKVNDPWPTAFESSGFDLDAVAVLNENNETTEVSGAISGKFIMFPNPLEETRFLTIEMPHFEYVDVYNSTGKNLGLPKVLGNGKVQIDFSGQTSGLYFVNIAANGKMWKEKILVNK